MIIKKKSEFDIFSDYSHSPPSHWYYWNSSYTQIDILNNIYVSLIVVITGNLWTTKIQVDSQAI